MKFYKKLVVSLRMKTRVLSEFNASEPTHQRPEPSPHQLRSLLWFFFSKYSKMLLKSVLHGLGFAMAAATVNANAIPAPVEPGMGEIVRFKRDAILDTRDLEIAERHQVNLTESKRRDLAFLLFGLAFTYPTQIVVYKHSVIKRDDGDDVIVWVDNHFVDTEGPEEDPSLDKRQIKVQLKGGLYWVQGGSSDRCRDPDRKDATGPRGATTGGIDAMCRWAETHSGYFRYGNNFGGWGWRTIMIAGSNGGANARYRAQFITGQDSNQAMHIGTRDLYDDADWTRDRKQNYDGKWRAASYGWESCLGDTNLALGRANFELRPTTENI